MVLDVVRRDSNLLLKTRLISLRLYRVQIHSYQKGFSFDRFVRRGVVFLVLVLVCQMGFPLVWVRVSCCDVVSLLHWVLPQCLVLRGAVLLVRVLVSCCASLLCWVLPQRLCILVQIRWFRGQSLGAEMFLVGVWWFLVREMFLVWIAPSFVCFLRFTKSGNKSPEIQCFVTTRRSGSLVTSCCDTTVCRIEQLELLLRLQVT